MENKRKLILIKLVHTTIWTFFVLVIGSIVYAGLVDRITLFVWIAIGLVVFEGVILLLNNWRCPLTLLAKIYTDSTADNFDIFLPKWLARNNKIIFTIIFSMGLVLVIWRAVGE